MTHQRGVVDVFPARLAFYHLRDELPTGLAAVYVELARLLHETIETDGTADTARDGSWRRAVRRRAGEGAFGALWSLVVEFEAGLAQHYSREGLRRGLRHDVLLFRRAFRLFEVSFVDDAFFQC